MVDSSGFTLAARLEFIGLPYATQQHRDASHRSCGERCMISNIREAPATIFKVIMLINSILK
ncbi:protein of unknown function [Enterobacter cancerogenus]|nr:protein of unknown function [Enterobacter cancerogenus]